MFCLLLYSWIGWASGTYLSNVTMLMLVITDKFDCVTVYYGPEEAISRT